MASATPDLRLPSQPQGITALWPVPNLLLGDKCTCVWTTCPILLPQSGTAEIRTRDLLSRKSKSQRRESNWRPHVKGHTKTIGHVGIEFGCGDEQCIIYAMLLWVPENFYVFLSVFLHHGIANRRRSLLTLDCFVADCTDWRLSAEFSVLAPNSETV